MHHFLCWDGNICTLWRPPLKTWIQPLPDPDIKQKNPRGHGYQTNISHRKLTRVKSRKWFRSSNDWSEKWATAHTIKYGTRIKTIPKHVQLVAEKYPSIFVGNKIGEKNTAINGEIRRLPANNENTAVTPDNMESRQSLTQFFKSTSNKWKLQGPDGHHKTTATKCKIREDQT